jgi:nucleotide-binding universal stress UspA family protein
MEMNDTPYRVVVGLDFSELGDRAVVEAVRACRGYRHAELHVLVVGSDEDGFLRLPTKGLKLFSQEEADAVAREHVGNLLKNQESVVHSTVIDRVAVYVAPGIAAERVVALAQEAEAELIVLGTHSRQGFARWVLGSVAEEVVRSAPCAVLVIRPRDFLNGEKLPSIDAPLKPGEHSLKPFKHRPTYHYVQRRQSSRVMPTE